MWQIAVIIAVVLALSIGSILGYFARQSIARKKADKIETTLQRRIAQVKKEADEITLRAKQKASQYIDKTKRDIASQKQEIFKTEKLLLKRENILAEKTTALEEKETDFNQKVERLREIKAGLEELRQKAISNLERIANLSRDHAKKELLSSLEAEYQKELMERLKKIQRRKNK